MGDPKRQRKKYSTPSHPWQRVRIDEERELKKEYGLKNKKEIWKMSSTLKKFTRQAKHLIAGAGLQAEKERMALKKKLGSLGLIGENADLSAILGITLKNIMDRRLQTIVYRKKLAKSIKQARQFITHEHVSVGRRKITAPSYLVSLEEEGVIQFHSTSQLSNSEHPERLVAEKTGKKV